MRRTKLGRATGRAPANRLSTAALVLSGLYLLSCIVISVTPPAEAYSVYEPSSYNGYKIFLSPAYHTAVPGAQGECLNRTERLLAQFTAREAGYRDYHGYVFTERGYRVAIGWSGPGTNKNDSNSWGADYHIPMHSNYRTQPGGCTSTDGSGNGTHVIYVSTAGSNLSAKLAHIVGEVTTLYGSPSPGTDDRKGHVNTGITSYDCIYNNGVPDLTEVCNTTAVAAYSESEFHNWNLGVNWLERNDWQSRFGWAVDSYLGYP